MAYNENITIEIELHDTALTVVCDLDYNGPFDSEAYLHSVNGMPKQFFKTEMKSEIAREVISQWTKNKNAREEAHGEMMSDESRNN